jgi:hypothetical protein
MESIEVKEKAMKGKKELIEELKKFKSELEEIPKNGGIESLIRFFQVVSSLQDTSIIEFAKERRKFGLQKSMLERLNREIVRNGRCPHFGVNRSYPGEKISEDKIFLGCINGLSIHSVSWWKSHPEPNQKTLEHLNKQANFLLSRDKEELIRRTSDLLNTF